ncbi:MAG: glycosyltransferase family 2 protein [bacterium]
MPGLNNQKLIFSIIIINYNTKQLTTDCIHSLLKHCPHHLLEVIVVDNDSRDGSVISLRETFGEAIKIIVNQHNVGFGRANNQAAKIAKGELLFFLNSDTIITADILSPLAKIMSDNDKLGIVSPRLLLPDGQHQTYAYGGFKWPLVKAQRQTNDLQVDEKAGYWLIGWVSGAALVISHKLFSQLQGYDHYFFMYYEDMDLCYRAGQLGYQVAVCPQIKLTHLGGGSSNLRQRKKYYYHSQTYFYRKHCGWLIAVLLRAVRWPWELYYYFHKILRIHHWSENN